MSTEDTKPAIITALKPREDFGNSQWGLCPAVVRDLGGEGVDLFRYAQQTAPYLSDLLPLSDTADHDKI